MIRCIVADKNKSWEQFPAALTKVITGTYPNSEVVLIQSIQYWKEADNIEVIYNIINDTPVLICNFIKVFNLTWIYTNGMIFSVEKKSKCL